MSPALRVLARPLAVAIVLLVAFPSRAAADEGTGCSLLSSGRPACTVLRRATTSSARRSAELGDDECIVLVGGLRSPTGYDDRWFDPLLAQVVHDRPYGVIRSGLEPESRGHAYDTVGAISRNGEELRALIRDISGGCQAIHVVTHSMGGAVADRAFSMGDLADDGVVTYVALSGPHNGAFGARAVRWGVELDDRFASGVSAVSKALDVHDPTSAAVRDLARAHAPRPPREIEQVRLRLVTDEIVLHHDSADRRIDVREYLATGAAQLEGHGGVRYSERIQGVVARTIASHHVPPEDRSARELEAAAVESARWELVYGGADVLIGSALVVGAAATRKARGVR